MLNTEDAQIQTFDGMKNSKTCIVKLSFLNDKYLRESAVTNSDAGQLTGVTPKRACPLGYRVSVTFCLMWNKIFVKYLVIVG